MKNSRVLLYCEADGNPPPLITWSWKKGRTITNSTKGMSVLQGGRFLVLERMKARYSSRYTCTASNIVGARKEVVQTLMMGNEKKESICNEHYSSIFCDYRASYR